MGAHRRGPFPIYKPPGMEDNCRRWEYDCTSGNALLAIEAIEVAILFTYFVLFFYYLGRAFQQLHTRNYR